MATAIVATAFGGPEVLAVVEKAVPDPQRGEVTIQVKAASVNPIDYKLYGGMFGSDPDRLPLPVGLEISGVVTAVGPEATGPAGAVEVGDDVIASGISGGYATDVTVPVHTVLPKPANLSWEQASGLFLTGGTAVHALTVTDVGKGDVVLIHGVSGGVGLSAAQLAVARGARVIGTAAEVRHGSLRRYGVEPVQYGPGLADRVRALAPGGVDAAIDAVGTDEAVDVSLELVSDKNRITSIAAFQRGAEVGIKLLGAAAGADPGTEIRAAARSELLALAAEGKFDVVIGKTFPLTEAAAAHEFVAGGHAGGKVVLLP